MAQNKTVQITVSKARRQVNYLGRSLIIYTLLNMIAWYGGLFLIAHYPDLLPFNPMFLSLGLMILITLWFAKLRFPKIREQLQLDIEKYMVNPEISKQKLTALACIAIGILLLCSSISNGLWNLLHPLNDHFAYLGNFTSLQNILLNIFSFVYFVIVKPISDEYIFRGSVQRQLGHYGRYFGIYSSAIIYALCQPIATDVFPALVLGWFLGMLTMYYHSLYPALTVHIAAAAFFWVLRILPDQWIFIPMILVIGVYVIIILSIVFNLLNTKVIQPDRPIANRLWKIVFTSSSMIILIILFILNIITSHIIL